MEVMLLTLHILAILFAVNHLLSLSLKNQVTQLLFL